jgi:rhodanese-related sulfurtransferase
VPDVPLEISVEEARRLIDAGQGGGERVMLIDVREPEEYELARIDGAELIPMRAIPQKLMHFEDREEPLLVLCHHGVRSLQVAAWLREHGVENAQSVQGGIDAWSRRIDPGIPRY